MAINVFSPTDVQLCISWWKNLW